MRKVRVPGNVMVTGQGPNGAIISEAWPMIGMLQKLCFGDAKIGNGYNGIERVERLEELFETAKEGDIISVTETDWQIIHEILKSPSPNNQWFIPVARQMKSFMRAWFDAEYVAEAEV